MQAWWEALTTLERVFTCIAIPSTLILLIQTILLLIGIGDNAGPDAGSGEFVSDGVDTDTDTDLDTGTDTDGGDISTDGGLHLFTLRGIVAFLAVMGWMGYTLLKSDVPTALSIIISVASGFVIMVLIAVAFYYFGKLQSDGNININNALGKSGTVYLNIPAERNGFGKINLVLHGQLGEFDAVTDETETIKFGTEVLVIGISGSSTLVVKRK